MCSYKYISFYFVAFFALFFGSCKKKEIDTLPPPSAEINVQVKEGVYIFDHVYMYRSYVNPNAPLHYEHLEPDSFGVNSTSGSTLQIDQVSLFFVLKDSHQPDKYAFTDNQNPEYYSSYYTCEWYPNKDSISLIHYTREPNGLHVDSWAGVWSPL